MSHFECRLNQRFWHSKSCTSCPNWGGGNLDKIQKNNSFFLVPNAPFFYFAAVTHQTGQTLIEWKLRSFEQRKHRLEVDQIEEFHRRNRWQWWNSCCLEWMSWDLASLPRNLKTSMPWNRSCSRTFFMKLRWSCGLNIALSSAITSVE